MNTKLIIVLFLQEAKDALINWYADMIINDRSNLIDHIKEGKIQDICPDFSNPSFSELIKQIRDLNLGEQFVTGPDIQQVVIQFAEYAYEIIWDRGNLSPEELKAFDAKFDNYDYDNEYQSSFSPAYFDESRDSIDYREEGW